MAGKTVTINKLRKILLLHIEGKSKRFISTYLQLSRNTVKKYIRTFTQLKLTLEDINSLENGELADLILSSEEKRVSPRVKTAHVFFKYAEKELKRTGVTRMVL